MPVRSHVDFCTFVRTIHIQGRDVPDEVAAMLIDRPDADAASAAWMRLYEQRRDIIFHEGYHVWQGARLPFLYWYGMHSFRSAVRLFSALDDIEDVEEWEAFVPSLYRLDLTWHAWWSGDGAIRIARQLERPPADVAGDVRLSVLDLLENAASLAQYQVTEGPERAVDGRAFGRWRKRHASYVSAVRFLAAYLGSEELALRVLIPMVCQACTTSDPVRAFFLLARGLHAYLDRPLVKRFIAQAEPCRWRELLTAVDEDNVVPAFEAADDASDNVLLGPFCRLTMEAALGWHLEDGRAIEHPLMARLARTWREREAEDPGLGWMLEQPAWSGADRMQRALNEFQPPVTVIRVQLPDERGRVMYTSPHLDGGTILALLTLWSVVRRAAGAHFDADNRLCHHARCPHFDANYCNTFPAIPEHFETCGFPQRVVELREGRRRISEVSPQ